MLLARKKINSYGLEGPTNPTTYYRVSTHFSMYSYVYVIILVPVFILRLVNATSWLNCTLDDGD